MKLSTGKEVDDVCGVIGIGHDLGVYGGFDSHIDEDFAKHPTHTTTLTRDEKIELAELMIARWQLYLVRLKYGSAPA